MSEKQYTSPTILLGDAIVAALQNKPIRYDENLPDAFKEEFDLSEEELKQAKALDKLDPIKRARKGVDAWNLWVKAYKRERWCIYEEHQDHILVRLPSNEDTDIQLHSINFDLDKNYDEQGRYKLNILKFIGFIFPAATNFSNAFFDKGCNFEDAVFAGDATFTNVYTPRDRMATFYQTHFLKDLYFKDTTLFAVSFDYATFDGTVDFSSVWINYGSSFENARFRKETNFVKTNFGSETNLYWAMFQENVHFEHVTFVDYVAFKPVCLGQLSIVSAVFTQDADFETLRVAGDFTIQSSSFFHDFQFSLCQVDGHLSFKENLIVGQTVIKKLELQASLNIENSVFFGPITTQESTFMGDVCIRETQFLNGVDFSNSEFHSSFHFCETWFWKTSSTPRAALAASWDHDIEELYQSIEHSFETCLIPDFRETKFAHAPDFSKVHLPAPKTANGLGRFFEVFRGNNKPKEMIDTDATPKLLALTQLAKDSDQQEMAEYFETLAANI